MSSARADSTRDLRLHRARILLSECDAEAILVSHPPDVRYLTGFTGSNGWLVVTDRTTSLVTDGRYRQQAREETADIRIVIAGDGLQKAITDLLPDRVLFQGDHLAVSEFESLKALSPSVRWTALPASWKLLRASKDEREIDAVRNALALSEQVMSRIVEGLVLGITEQEVAAKIDFEHARLGSERPAFETIVAFGPSSARPHARAGSNKLRSGDVVLLDFGCVIGGYCSDITRTFFYGDPDPSVLEIYQVVKRAQNSAIGAAVPGSLASEVDRAARSVIETAGFGEAFMHSTGHGVGLEIHEWPRLGATSESLLAEHSVVTIEPGVYFPGRFGIRIEDMIVVETAGATRLNRLGVEAEILPVRSS